MKNIILFLVISCNCFAQQNIDFNSDPNLIWRNIHRRYNYISYNYFNSNYDFYYDYAPFDVRKKANIKGVKQTYINKKGKKGVTEMEFNRKGFLISSKNPSRKYEFKADYLHDSLQVYSLSKSKKSKTEYKREFVNGKKTSEIKTDDGKQDYLMLIDYNASGKVNESKVKQGKNEYKMLYEYGNTGKVTKNTYLKNNKIKKIWNYECKPEGALEASNKTEIISSKCEYREENSDGSYIVFERILREGKPYLTESKFTRDSIAYEINTYEKDSILTQSWTRNGLVETRTYFKKGKVQYQYRYTYNDKKQMLLNEHFKKGKKTYVYKNTYDEKGNRVLEENLSPEDLSVRSSHRREFNENGTLKSEIVHYRGKLWYQFSFEYTFQD